MNSTGLPALRHAVSLTLYHALTLSWKSGQSLPSVVTFSAHAGFAACSAGVVSQQSVSSAVFHERYCAVVFSLLRSVERGVGKVSRA